MKKIKLLLTFDYELPLGKCTDFGAGLFDPASRLMKLAKEEGFPLVFFADICSALRFKEWDFQGYYTRFRDQLRETINLGNDVQLHIHPHWMDTNFKDNRFIPSTKFSLSNFRDDPNWKIEEIIQTAYDCLISILAQNKGYRCIAFRAGGYDVEPESERILTKLRDLGIIFESSVIKGLYLNNKLSKIDYRNCPSGSQWPISKKGPVNDSLGSDLLELPITRMPIGLADIIGRRIKKTISRSLLSTRIYDNKGKGYHDSVAGGSFKNKLLGLFNPKVLSVDKVNYEVSDLLQIVNYNVKLYSSEKEDLILTLIGHPKSMGSYHLELLRKFVDAMRSRYKDQIEFVTYLGLYKELNSVKKD